MNLKLGSHSFHLSLTVLALAAGALFMYVHLGNGAAVNQWLATAHQELHTSMAWKDRAAALKKQSDQARASAARWQDSTTVAVAAFDSLLKLAQQPASLPTANVTLGQLGAACHLAVADCEKRASDFARADTTDRLRADSAERRAAVADSIIRVGVKATTCHFLALFPCPSREQAFAGGTGLGVLLYWFLAKH